MRIIFNIFDYWNKKISVSTNTGKKFIGNVEDVIPADENDSNIGSIVIRPSFNSEFSGKLVEISENEIDSIEVID